MRLTDILQFTGHALQGFRVRTWLMLLAMTIAVAAILLLTALGEGARRYVVNEFASLGTHLLIVLPGRSETTGGAPPLLGETPRDLTLEDANSLLRSSAVEMIAPLSVGSALVAHGGLERESTILGSTQKLLQIRHLALSSGQFLPAMDDSVDKAICVLGQTIKEELFQQQSALGQWVRIGERRFRVIGVLRDEGQALGAEISEVVIIPVASAQGLFDNPSLFRILVQAKSREAIPRAKTAISEIIRARHDGEDDVTVITQDAILSTFDQILTVLTLALAGIATISLLVAGILIMNVMLIAVSQRKSEIGLLLAVGATRAHILILFLVEAALLALLGALMGLAVGYTGNTVIARFYPDFPVAIPLWAVIAAVTVSLLSGIIFGVSPARRAARLHPVEALAGRG
jgi:putative ABC transport system permease protein